jgi:FkbH-like protein
MASSGSVTIANKVKLVVWDLDETFWRGTLAEEGMTRIDGNAETVIELSKRGIVNAICSNNDRERAKAELVEMGVWDYFVFPSIGFDPKGRAVARMIEDAALRAENVLFVDDNPSNLAEVKFFNPGIMAARPIANK